MPVCYTVHHFIIVDFRCCFETSKKLKSLFKVESGGVETERERQTEREREREREREKETDRQTDRERHTERDAQTETNGENRYNYIHAYHRFGHIFS